MNQSHLKTRTSPRGVALPGRALRSGRGRWFESSHPDHTLTRFWVLPAQMKQSLTISSLLDEGRPFGR